MHGTFKIQTMQDDLGCARGVLAALAAEAIAVLLFFVVWYFIWICLP